MPRFTEDQMKEAVLKVTEGGLSVNRVAKEDGLCKKTLKSYVDKYLNNDDNKNEEIRFRPNYEINQVFTNEHEKIFEDHLISLNNTKQITREFVRKSAYKFATKCNVHVPKTWNVRKQAGLDWMYGYLNRHPKIKSMIVRNKKATKQKLNFVTPEFTTDENGIISIEDIRIDDEMSEDDSDLEIENTSLFFQDNLQTFQNNYYNSVLKREMDQDNDPLGSSNYLSKINVKTPLDEFQENLTHAYAATAENGIVDAEHVYSLDEIALVVNRPYSRHKDLVVTACCFINAAGEYLPSFFVFPRKKFRRSMLEGLPEGTDGTARLSGRLDDDSFMLVLEHFQDLVKATPTNRVMLIMEDDNCHVTINSLDFCEQNGIEIVTLPPHCAQNLQPTGRYVFPMVKLLFNQCIYRFRTTKLESLNAYHMALFFCRIQPLAFSNENISQGFSDTGIFPLNEQVFRSVEFQNQKHCNFQLPENLPIISLDLPPHAVCYDNHIISDNESPVDNEDEPVLQASSSTCTISNFSFGKSPMEEFFNNLVQGYGELEQYGGIQAEKIYNLDEIEIRIGSATKSNYAPSCMSICCCVNAVGRSLPPFLIYPENEFSSEMLNCSIDGMNGTSSSNGRLDSTIFLQILEHFQQFLRASPSNRIMLILDCENYHISLQTIDFCDENGIVVVTVPPHISEPFQPLERTVFQTLPSNFQQECLEHMQRKGETGISVFDIATLLCKTFENSFAPDTIVNGFEVTGLWPLNHELFAQDTRQMNCTKKLNLVDDTESSCVLGEVSEMFADDEDIVDSDTDGSSMSDDEVLQFFDKIEHFLNTLSDDVTMGDERIFVLGEAHLETEKVVANVMLFVNAVGTLLPPFLIYSTNNANDELLESSLGITGFCSEQSVVDECTFFKIIHHFREHSYACEEHKVLLLVKNDGGTRLTDAVESFGSKHGIIFQKFPSSDEKRFHPLENSFIKTLMQRFKEMTAATNSQSYSINDVVTFLEQIFIELFVVEEVVAKFKEYGICSTRTTDQIVVPDDENQNERGPDDFWGVGQKVKVGFMSEHSYKKMNVHKFEDFIIEEEIEMTLNDDEVAKTEHLKSKITFLCCYCEMEFKMQKDLENHEKNSQCRYCDLVCCTISGRGNHERTHMKGTLHCCPYCDKECTSRTALMQHRRKHLQKKCEN